MLQRTLQAQIVAKLSGRHAKNKLQQTHKHKHKIIKQFPNNNKAQCENKQNKPNLPSTPISWNVGACLSSDKCGADSQAHTSATLIGEGLKMCCCCCECFDHR